MMMITVSVQFPAKKHSYSEHYCSISVYFHLIVYTHTEREHVDSEHGALEAV